MATSTNLISGLVSGFDWQSLVTSLINADHARVDLVTSKKTETESKLKEWQSVNTKLLALKTAAEKLDKPASFSLYTASMTTDSSTVGADDLLTVSAGTDAAPGSYALKITNLAQAQKLSSNPFTSKTTALGSDYAGEILINGKKVSISATDTLSNVADKINTLNSGSSPSNVTASIVSFGTNDYRLILTNDVTGAEGISLVNGSSANLVQQFGWKDNQTATMKNSITSGVQSDRFTSSTTAVKSLLGLSTGESGSVTIGEGIGAKTVAINLSTMSLTDIKTAINTAGATGVTASIISEEADGETYYRLQIDGTQAFSDNNNILNTLGVLDHSSTDVAGKISGNSMTTNGAKITGSTLLKNIDGYNTFTTGDYIALTGNSTSDGDVSDNFTIQSTTTVQDLLDEIKAQYGNVLAYVTADGKIRVDDLSGSGKLSVKLEDHIQASGSALEFTTGDASFGAASTRKRQIVAGEDAVVEVDGVEVTNSSNTIDSIISGVTLNLAKEDADTTVNLTVSRDTAAIKKTVQDFISKYNDIRSYINTQSAYDSKTQKTGGVLFGDGTLSSVKSDLISSLTQSVWGVNSAYSTLSLAGITMDKNGLLSLNDSTFTALLKSNFNDVKSLFTASGTSSSSDLSYISSSNKSQAGEYAVHIDRAATKGSGTGSVDLSAGGASDTLTVTQGNGTANLVITPGMTISDIVNALNTEFAGEYTQVLAGSLQLKQSDGTTPISAETAWNNISGATLQNGDVISFSGTSRSGTEISGAYTISNTGTQTVQGLLTAIEDAFAGQVKAEIDSSGRIMLTDLSSGYSQIALDITEPDGRGLDFGTVLKSNTGGQEGRYAMTLTALDDGSGHLEIQNNVYGDSGSFTISQDSSDNQYDQVIFTNHANTTTDTDGAASISASTVWGKIYGAQVANGDTITISGTARDGATPISGTYTISDKTTDTVDGLLTAIESAYSAQGTTVNAFIRDGKVFVEDLASGSSAIALTLTASNEGGGSLSLGTIGQTTQRDLDLGLINGSYAGQNVAGTIGGEAATGLGQALTGNAGNTKTSGLSILSTGTSDNTDAGTVTLTVGTAELFSRVLFSITDSSEGYVASKQTSLQSRIDSYGTQIDNMEAQLDRKQEMLTNQFVQMETALSKLKNQSSWLSAQTSAASSGWVL